MNQSGRGVRAFPLLMVLSVMAWSDATAVEIGVRLSLDSASSMPETRVAEGSSGSEPLDLIDQPAPPGLFKAFYFTVDRFAQGLPDAAANIYTFDPDHSFSPPQLFRTAAALGLQGGFFGDDVNALDMRFMIPPAPGTLEVNSRYTFETYRRNSPLGAGHDPCDIIFRPTGAVFAHGVVDLGLNANDHIDGLILLDVTPDPMAPDGYRREPNGILDEFDMAIISLDPFSPSTMTGGNGMWSPADLIMSDLHGGLTIYRTAAQLGLLESDNIDGLAYVPEPASLMLLAGVGCLFMRRRTGSRRKSHGGAIWESVRGVCVVLMATAASLAAFLPEAHAQCAGAVRNFCGDSPPVAGSSCELNFNTGINTFCFSLTATHPAVSIPHVQAQQANFVGSLGNPDRVVFSHTAQTAAGMVSVNGQVVLSTPARAIVDVAIVGGTGQVRYLLQDRGEFAVAASVSPTLVQACGGEQTTTTLTIYPVVPSVGQVVTGTWSVAGPPEYGFAPTGGPFSFSGSPPNFSQIIQVNNLMPHAGNKMFTVTVTPDPPRGCPPAPPIEITGILQLTPIRCSTTNQSFEEIGDIRTVRLSITNPCNNPIDMSWSLTGGNGHYDLPKMGMIAGLAGGATTNVDVNVKNLSFHGPPEPIALHVESASAGPCDQTVNYYSAPPRILRLESRYTAKSRNGMNERRAAYLAGYPIHVILGGETFTATIDWRGHAPGNVEFIKPSGLVQAPTNTNTASLDLDIGTGFPVDSSLRARPLSADGTPPSNELKANFRVVNAPLPLSPLVLFHKATTNHELKYATINAVGTAAEGGGASLPDSTFPGALPGQGGVPLASSFAFSGGLEISGTNRVTIMTGSVVGKLSNIAQQNMGKFVFGKFISRGYVLTIRWRLPENSNQWVLDGGTLGVTITPLAYACPPKPFRFIIPTPVIGIPAYWKVTLGIAGEANFGITGYSGVDRMSLLGNITVIPSFEAALGVLDPKIGVEGYLGGALKLGFRYPAPAGQGITQFDLIGKGGIRLNVWIFTFNLASAQCTWSLICSNNCFACSYGFGGLRSDEWELAPRDYLENEFAVFNPAVMTERGGGGTQEFTLVTNEFPFPAPQISRSGDDLLLGWLSDDEDRDSLDRTTLVSSRFHSGAWSTPAPISDDGTADFEPQIAGTANGSGIAAWTNLRESGGDDGSPDTIQPEMEISVALFDGASGAWGPQQTLTDNGYLDHFPRLAAASDGTAMLAWVANLSNDLNGAPAMPNQIMWSRFDGTTWSAPAVAASGVSAIVDMGIAYDGNEATLVYSVDADAEFGSAADTELYAQTFNGSAWSVPLRLTNDDVSDTNPHPIYQSGQPLLVWNRDGSIVSARNPDLSDLVTAVTLEAQSSGASEFALAAATDGRLAVAWTDGSTDLVDPFYAFFDAAHNVWSQPRQLSHDRDDERNLTAAFDADGSLVGAFRKIRIDRHEETAEYNGETYQIMVPSVNHTDLEVVTHTFDGDLAVSDEISFDPPNPVPGETDTVTATVANVGDIAAENIAVAFYDGDPLAGGQLIAVPTLAGPLAGGESGVVTAPWTVPTSAQPRTIYVVVDPGLQIADVDRSNNTASIVALGPNLVIEESWVDEPTPCSRLVHFTVRNAAAVPAGAFEVKLHRLAADGEVLATYPITGLQPNEVSETFDYLEDQPILDTDATELLYAVADEAGAVVEFSETDNSAAALLDFSHAEAADCNANQIPDACEIQFGLAADCNANEIPDECDISAATSNDCDADGVPDECEIDASSTAPGGPFYCADSCDPDCNQNGIPDACDISGGASNDCNDNGIPDECEIMRKSPAPGGPFFCEQDCDPDCNANGIPDACDIAGGGSADKNMNNIPDECESGRVAPSRPKAPGSPLSRG